MTFPSKNLAVKNILGSPVWQVDYGVNPGDRNLKLRWRRLMSIQMELVENTCAKYISSNKTEHFFAICDK